VRRRAQPGGSQAEGLEFEVVLSSSVLFRPGVEIGLRPGVEIVVPFRSLGLVAEE
jgi:hypothetical protein